ncbi:hypothetical protein ACHWQZ_G015129 [Mnemiopsis leidyi]
MMSEILTAMRPSHRKTNDSYSGKLDYPNSYHGPTCNIPEKAVKTNVKPAQTVVVSKDISCSLSKGSSEIKKEFNKLYEGVSIENCFASKGGSIFIELTNEDVAKKVVDNWKTYYFTDRDKGPKEGTVCKLLSSVQNSVIVKAVPTDLAEEFIEKSIEELYPGARVKRFVKTGNVKLRTVKIDFIIPGQSDEMIKNGLLLNNLLFRAEKYIPRQRVIQCYHCYKFGHVAKFCHQKKPTCPFCAQAHYHEECDHTRQLCCNCLSPNHYATNRNCPKFQAVLEKIKNPRETNNQNSQHESQNLNKNLDNDF